MQMLSREFEESLDSGTEQVTNRWGFRAEIDIRFVHYNNRFVLSHLKQFNDVFTVN